MPRIMPGKVAAPPTASGRKFGKVKSHNNNKPEIEAATRISDVLPIPDEFEGLQESTKTKKSAPPRIRSPPPANSTLDETHTPPSRNTFSEELAAIGNQITKPSKTPPRTQSPLQSLSTSRPSTSASATAKHTSAPSAHSDNNNTTTNAHSDNNNTTTVPDSYENVFDFLEEKNNAPPLSPSLSLLTSTTKRKVKQAGCNRRLGASLVNNILEKDPALEDPRAFDFPADAKRVKRTHSPSSTQKKRVPMPHHTASPVLILTPPRPLASQRKPVSRCPLATTSAEDASSPISSFSSNKSAKTLSSFSPSLLSPTEPDLSFRYADNDPDRHFLFELSLNRRLVALNKRCGPITPPQRFIRPLDHEQFRKVTPHTVSQVVLTWQDVVKAVDENRLLVYTLDDLRAALGRACFVTFKAHDNTVNVPTVIVVKTHTGHQFEYVLDAFSESRHLLVYAVYSSANSQSLLLQYVPKNAQCADQEYQQMVSKAITANGIKTKGGQIGAKPSAPFKELDSQAGDSYQHMPSGTTPPLSHVSLRPIPSQARSPSSLLLPLTARRPTTPHKPPAPYNEGGWVAKKR